MARYRRKPTETDAVQWFPGADVPEVYREDSVATIGGRGHGSQSFPQEPRWYVVTIHGQRAYLEPGDWVLPEPGGEGHYPVKDEVFRAMYESVPE